MKKTTTNTHQKGRSEQTVGFFESRSFMHATSKHRDGSPEYSDLCKTAVSSKLGPTSRSSLKISDYSKHENDREITPYKKRTQMT